VRTSSLITSPSADEPDTVIEVLSADMEELWVPPALREAAPFASDEDGEGSTTGYRDGQLAGLIRTTQRDQVSNGRSR
jgi:hypothetical protein